MRGWKTIDGAADRFWSHVSKRAPDECWEWTAAKNGHGYGCIQFGRVKYTAHRLAYELTHGPIERRAGWHGTCVCHRCDNRACVNPSHLFLGSNADNIADMHAKGRAVSPRGERSGRAKLVAAQVVEIRRLRAGGVTYEELSRRFHVSQAACVYIVSGKNWSHIEGGLK